MGVEQQRVEPVVATVEVPPGVLGPNAVTFEVRSFVAAGPEGLVLIDTGPPGNAASIGRAIAALGAEWADVADIVLTHHHFDHAGGLRETADLAPRARIWSGAEDASAIVLDGDRNPLPLADGQHVGAFRVVATPGHTAGHISLLDEEGSLVLIGDLVGSERGELTFGPPSFTADPVLNTRSLRRILKLDPARMLFSHGAELPDPARAIRLLLDETSSSPPPDLRGARDNQQR